jgi:hypothetical protein
MRNRPAVGEVGLALVFAIVGVIWIAGALRLPFWEGFAPQSGFMPIFYGVLLTALALAVLIGLFFGTETAPENVPIGKPFLVLVALTATVVGVEPAGFGVAVFLLLLFLFAFVEKLPLPRALLVAGGTTAVLVLLFKTWLGVPLPSGPLGI